jgi:peptide/nickel transport system permease protein
MTAAGAQAPTSDTARGFWEAFIRFPLAKFSLVMLGLIAVLAALADQLAPYRNFYTNRDLNLSPPTTIRFLDDQGRLVRPFIYHYVRSYDAQGRPWYEVDTTVRYELRFFVRSSDPRDAYTPFPVNLIPAPLRDWLGIRVTSTLKLMAIDAPMDQVPFYPLGSDIVGNCILSSILYGTRWSLAIGLGGTLVAAVIGLSLALFARLVRGALNAWLLGLKALVSVMPSVFLLLAVLTLFAGLDLPLWLAILFVLIDAALVDLGTLGRSFYARLRMLGEAPVWRPRWRLEVAPPRTPLEHFWQHGLGYVVVGWGFVLSVQRTFVDATYLERWWVLLPAPLLLLAVFCWTIIGDALREALERQQLV